MRFRILIRSSTVLSAPGIISIFISLLSIPIHLNQADQKIMEIILFSILY